MDTKKKTPQYTLNAIKKYQAKNKDLISDKNKDKYLIRKQEINDYNKLQTINKIDTIETIEDIETNNILMMLKKYKNCKTYILNK